MKKRKQFFRPRWKDHFSFSRRERRGMFVLVSLLIVQSGVLYYLRTTPAEAVPSDWSAFESKADSLLEIFRLASDTASVAPSNTREQKSNFSRQETHDSLFAFDPNTLSAAGWQKLGLSEKQAAVIVRYREKGGKFRVKGDLNKIRVIKPELIQRLMPLAQLPDSAVRQSFVKDDKKINVVDLNSADSAEFEKLRGVGPSLAGRIVRYRERLGGFISPEQLREIWGMNDSLLAVLLPQVEVKPPFSLRRIRINIMPDDSIKRHPYIGFALGKQLTAFRAQHPVHSMEELRSLPLVTDEISRKLAPYLDFR